MTESTNTTKTPVKNNINDQYPIESSPYIAMMEKYIDTGNIENIGKLMDYQDRWEAKIAKEKYCLAFTQFQKNCPAIVKRKDGYGYKYAPLDDIVSQIKDLLADCGLTYSWETSQTDTMIKVICTIHHIGGHSESNYLIAPPDAKMKTNTFAITSTVTNLKRYTLTNGLGIATADEDSEKRIEGIPEACNWDWEISNCKDMKALLVLSKKAQQAGDFNEIKPLLTAKRQEFEGVANENH